MSNDTYCSFTLNFLPVRVCNEEEEKHIIGAVACDFGISCPVCWRHIYIQRLNQMKQSETCLPVVISAVIQDFGYSCYKIPAWIFI